MNYFRCGGSEKVTIDGEKVKDKLELKSLVSDSVRVSTLPYDFIHGSVVVLNGEIHILGGTLGTANSGGHYKWNGATWEEVSTLPCNLHYGSAVVLNNKIHILGGQNPNSFYDMILHYVWDGNTWTQMASLPIGDDKRYVTSVVFNGEIHILGGWHSSSRVSMKIHYKWNEESNIWTDMGNVPYAYAFGCSVVLNDGIHILGGSNMNDIDTSSISTEEKKHYVWNGNTWTRMEDIPVSFGHGSAVTLNDEIHILGGSNQYYGKWKGKKYHYRRTNGTWEQLGNLAHEFYNGSAVACDGKINIFGGNTISSSSSDSSYNGFIRSHEYVGVKVYTT